MIFDYDIAMNYLGNNDKLFNIVASSFISSYENFEKDLISSINRNDLERVHLLIHTLKGITLNLGCVDLYEKCIIVLPFVKKNIIKKEDLEQLILVYKNSYNELLRNIS